MASSDLRGIEDELAVFEPDPDGRGPRDPEDEAAELLARSPGEVEQWIEWPDERDEDAWAAAELRSFGL